MRQSELNKYQPWFTLLNFIQLLYYNLFLLFFLNRQLIKWLYNHDYFYNDYVSDFMVFFKKKIPILLLLIHFIPKSNIQLTSFWQLRREYRIIVNHIDKDILRTLTMNTCSINIYLNILRKYCFRDTQFQ